MEITKERSGNFIHVRVSGRIDNYWSESFDEAFGEMIREGAHHLRLDLTGVTYLSSAGIGALVTAYRETTALQGTFVITEASDRVRTILQLLQLEPLLFGSPEGTAAPAQAPESAPVAAAAVPERIPSECASFESHVLDGGRSERRLIGDPGRLTNGGYGAEHTSSINVREDLFALGVGALGASYEDCSTLFGEFVAAAGSAAYMPTDGTSTPDYMMQSGQLVPELQALYAIEFRGAPSHLLRFEANDPGAAVPLSEVVRVCATVAGTQEFGVVMAAEVSGLVCTMLRRTPVQESPARFDFPSVREWLSFSPEHEHARTSSIIVGFATASASDAVRPFVRPVSDGFDGHFHAAVTSFRSLPFGKIKLADVLAQAFQPRSVFSVVHLLRDTRPIEGAGESEFHRGACWIFPLASDGGAA